MSISELVSLIVALLSIPMIISFYSNSLRVRLSKYNCKEKIILFTSITSIGLAFGLGILAVLQFINSIPTLFYIQTMSVHPTTLTFQDLMWFGVLSGIICSFLGYNLLRVNLKELRIVLSPKSFQNK